MGMPQGGARTVPFRSALAGRGDVEKGSVFAPDNPLRTGTVRGPMQRDTEGTRESTEDNEGNEDPIPLRSLRFLLLK